MKKVYFTTSFGEVIQGYLTGNEVNGKVEVKERDNTLHYVFAGKVKEAE